MKQLYKIAKIQTASFGGGTIGKERNFRVVTTENHCMEAIGLPFESGEEPEDTLRYYADCRRVAAPQNTDISWYEANNSVADKRYTQLLAGELVETIGGVYQILDMGPASR